MLCLSFVLMRCQPLRRALAHTSHKPELVSCYGISV
nr:C4-dicarboxylate ABC transporter [Vibrio cholerae]